MKQAFLFISLAILLLAGISCTGRISSSQVQSKVEAKLAPEYEDVEKKFVKLSDFPTDAEGFIHLSGNDASLKGWRGYGKDHLPGKWSVDKDILVFNSSGTGEGGDIIFAFPFRNFELELEWKISKEGNSGIFYLAREIITKDMEENERIEPIYLSALEYQVLDDEHNPDAKLGNNNNRISRALYDIVSAEPQNSKGFEKWNKARIIVRHGHVIHELNDVKVMECQLWTPEWKEKLQASKFSETKWPLAFELMNNREEKYRQGYIGLQDHGHDVWYRDIRIKVLN
ncbi:3-keto-disaccharide hydrolase [Bacteroides thetaiotaomicron]|uniref:3-keto-disaccharide hydrolase n=1 Tax=Bacteroides thetaiotaomicron TaxID=818 RepID=UPI00232D6092|nr:DUF1080 domain-containing protein [Bacteroides thetaiotaomicron]MDC2049005.1 DUF1080 domain-containing protein [Bacteroides thetaiotaomicron]